MAGLQRQNTPQITGPLDALNDPGESFKNPTQLEFVRTLISALKVAFQRTISRDQAAPYFHLQAPTGEVWKVTVNAAGALGTTRVRG
jgi:hypothetical protein